MNLRKRQRGVSAEVQTSAMNDIMFFLLLFFLIASTVTNPNVIKLLLPKSSSGKSVSKKTIVVSVTKDLKYYVDRKQVAIADLPAKLASYKPLATNLTGELITQSGHYIPEEQPAALANALLKFFEGNS